jgi:predicted alpha/beta-hydrolase family hydrolase
LVTAKGENPAMTLLSGPPQGPYLVLAHGAGAAMDSPFMNAIAEALARHGISVARFEFGYMAARRRSGKPSPPPPVACLEEEYRAFLDGFSHPIIAIGGKSLGGRVASRIVDSLGRNVGLVCLGYPFHPPGKPQSLRTSHLETLSARALIVQGERDALGERREVAALTLAPDIEIAWLVDGDHSFKPRKSSGASLDGNIAAAADAVSRFLGRLQSRV